MNQSSPLPKMASGSFGIAELNSHTKAHEFLGFYQLALRFLQYHQPSTCGQGYVKASELKQTIELLEQLRYAPYNSIIIPEIDHLTQLVEGKQ